MSPRRGQHFPLGLIRPHLFLYYRVQVGLTGEFPAGYNRDPWVWIALPTLKPRQQRLLQSDSLAFSMCALKEKDNEFDLVWKKLCCPNGEMGRVFIEYREMSWSGTF